MRIDFDVVGDVQVSRELLRIGEHAKDVRPAWRTIVDDLLDVGKAQFRTEGGRAHKWAALQPATIEAKRRDGDPIDILVRTGRLRDAATHRGAAGQEVLLHPAWMVFRLTDPHVRYHQLGEGVPRRRIIDLTERDRKRWMRHLQRWVITGETG